MTAWFFGAPSTIYCPHCVKYNPHIATNHIPLDCPDIRNPEGLRANAVSFSYTIIMNPFGGCQLVVQEAKPQVAPSSTIPQRVWCPYHRDNLNTIIVNGQIRCCRYQEH